MLAFLWPCLSPSSHSLPESPEVLLRNALSLVSLPLQILTQFIWDQQETYIFNSSPDNSNQFVWDLRNVSHTTLCPRAFISRGLLSGGWGAEGRYSYF